MVKSLIVRAEFKNLKLQPHPDSTDNYFICDCLFDDAIYVITCCMPLIKRLQKTDLLEETHRDFDLITYIFHRYFRKLLTTLTKLGHKLNKHFNKNCTASFCTGISTAFVCVRRKSKDDY